MSLDLIPGDDSWKGEHLIRAPKLNPPTRPDIFKIEKRGNGKTARRRMTPCAVPGCAELLWRTRTFVCKTHMHDPDFCRCEACKRRRAHP